MYTHSLGQWCSVYHLFQKSNRIKCFYNLPIAEDVDGIYVDDLVGDTIVKNKGNHILPNAIKGIQTARMAMFIAIQEILSGENRFL